MPSRLEPGIFLWGHTQIDTIRKTKKIPSKLQTTHWHVWSWSVTKHFWEWSSCNINHGSIWFSWLVSFISFFRSINFFPSNRFQYNSQCKGAIFQLNYFYFPSGLLEKACIRFVHFSKENELRSRVFSEKMGLESGWNCHISLRSSEGAMMKKTVSYCCPAGKVGKKKSGKRAAIPARLITNWKTNFGSLPDKLDRHPWFLDFPR